MIFGLTRVRAASGPDFCEATDPFDAAIRRAMKRPLFARKNLHLLSLAAAVLLLGACISPKKEAKTPTLLKTENATQAQLMSEIDRLGKVNSIKARMDLKFEDNSWAEFGSKEVYRSADGEVVVQRPGKIRLRVQVPIIKSDVAQMTSDGEKFRVAVLQDGGTGKYKKFIKGTNSADYSHLQKKLDAGGVGHDKNLKQDVNAFANLRPQHFTDAMLMRPIDHDKLYTQSTIFQIEEDESADKRSPIRKVMRGYYLLDEFARGADGGLTITRRFWFDRNGGIRLARQQIFDAKGEIESDILYFKEGVLAGSDDYHNMPIEIEVTRPQEKYAMRLSYVNPESALIGTTFPDEAFVLQNSWKLEEVDLDQKLAEASGTPPPNDIKSGATRFQ
jgi:hypothetical protein